MYHVECARDARFSHAGVVPSINLFLFLFLVLFLVLFPDVIVRVEIDTQAGGNIRVGDQVVKVQGESVKGFDFDEVGDHNLQHAFLI